MPIDLLALSAALLAGLLGSAHCAAMCGGIATTVAAGAVPLRASFLPALQSNLGRVAGYALAGALVGALGSGLLQIARMEWLTQGVRAAVGAVLILVALRLLLPAARLDPLAAPAQSLWRRLRPLQQHLLPARGAWRQFALGALWGWLPCGLSTTLLTAAWLQADALHGALTMTAFGLGTLPVMLPLSWSGARAAGWLGRRAPRTAAASALMLSGTLTLAAPWLMRVPILHSLLGALGCLGVA